MSWKLTVWVVLLGLLAGCGPVSPPAGQTPSPTAARSTVIEVGEQPVFYTVQNGDTLSTIAFQFGLSVKELLNLNGLNEDSLITVGQHLLLGYDSQLLPTKGVTPVTVAGPLIISTPYGLPTVVLPTSVPPLEGAAPLDLGSSPEAVRKRVLNPQWDTLWLDGSTTLYSPDGTVWNFHTQTWLDRHRGGQVLNSDQLADTPRRTVDMQPRWLSLSDGGSAVVYDLRENKIERPHTGWLTHPHEMGGYVMETVFPRFLEKLENPSAPVAEEVVAGRQTVAVDWGPWRMWIDAATGVILKAQQFDWANRDILTQEIIINEIAYQVDLPLETGLTYKSNQVFFDSGPVPDDYDYAQSQLQFESVMLVDPTTNSYEFAVFAVDIYADGYYLGWVETGRAPLMNCNRTADGAKLAFNYFEIDGDVIVTFRWFELGDVGTVYEPAPWLKSRSPVTWSPDNRHIAFSACPSWEEEECGLYILDTIREAIVFENHQGYSPWDVIWSPDGKYFAAVIRSSFQQFEGIALLRAFELADGALVYEGDFDLDAWEAEPDAPIHEWGVDIPRMSGGYPACE